MSNRLIQEFFSQSENNIHYLNYVAVKARPIISTDNMEIKGTPASKGKVQGRVRIVFGESSFDSFQKGEILVTEMTRPDFLPLMKKSVAILTDEGGLTCHAAIVARELGIPCIIGTKIATQVLKTGDMIEVDAERGVVIILSKPL